MALQVGSLVIAKRATGVCHFGEPGVVYEEYRLKGHPGWSVIFRSGRHDGFSPDDVEMCLHVTGQVAPEVASYQFSDARQLERDYEAGRFTAAFARVRTAPGGWA